MSDYSHGGDLYQLAQNTGRSAKDILDFSVNVRSEGAPDFVTAALWSAMNHVATYPSPTMRPLADLIESCWRIPSDCCVFGNGANELIHAIARSIHAPCAIIPEPAFSEYRLACQQAGLHFQSWICPENNGFAPHLNDIVSQAPHGALIFLANPCNPSGTLLDPKGIIQATKDRPDLVWVIDESFIDYVGNVTSVASHAYETNNLIILRSFTKFYGIAGVRCGLAISSPSLTTQIQHQLPSWNVNSFAEAAIRSILTSPPEWAKEEQKRIREAYNDLFSKLSGIPCIHPTPSHANFILFKVDGDNSELAHKLLVQHGIAIRDCSNYLGLENGKWFRVGVRSPQDHDKLINALRVILNIKPTTNGAPHISHSRKRPPALMIQGTCSDAGKSILTAAFCRILKQEGIRVAPFKAQNMALNSGVTASGEEIGRAQIVQARACKIDADARMNPILLKPHSDTGSQIILMGHPIGHLDAKDFLSAKRRFLPTVQQAYDSLAKEYDFICLEGAGCPAEINLKTSDIVNMSMAHYAQARVLLVGDIDRGGVYASFLGCWASFEAWERELLLGFVVNKFRGDATLLEPAHKYIQARTGKPVVGVIPMLPRIQIPEEDKAGFSWSPQDKLPDSLDVAVIKSSHVSNFTDFEMLAAEPDIRFRCIHSADDWGAPDLIILPGNKSVVSDLAELRSKGLDRLIKAHAQAGKWIWGICGGLQMLGHSISDPRAVESPESNCSGLGLLDLATVMQPTKIQQQIDKATSPDGLTTSGYEIHHGLSHAWGNCQPALIRPDGSVCGYETTESHTHIWASYLHGCFDDDTFRRAWINRVRIDSGLSPHTPLAQTYSLDASLDRLADAVRSRIDIPSLLSALIH